MTREKVKISKDLTGVESHPLQRTQGMGHSRGAVFAITGVAITGVAITGDPRLACHGWKQKDSPVSFSSVVF